MTTIETARVVIGAKNEIIKNNLGPTFANLYRWFNNWELHEVQAGHGTGEGV